jgi:hypothetical protein
MLRPASELQSDHHLAGRTLSPSKDSDPAFLMSAPRFFYGVWSGGVQKLLCHFVETGHPGPGKMYLIARSLLLVFSSFPAEAGLCPYIAGPALPNIPSRGPFFLPLFTGVHGMEILRS